MVSDCYWSSLFFADRLLIDADGREYLVDDGLYKLLIIDADDLLIISYNRW